MLKLELGVPGTKPFEERDFVIMEERLLEDVSNPLVLLCMRRWVVNVTGNGGLT